MIKQTIALPADLRNRLTRAAQLTGVPEAEIVRTALQLWLAQQPQYLAPADAASDAASAAAPSGLPRDRDSRHMANDG